LEQNLPHIINGCVNNNRLMQKALYAHCYEEMMKVCTRYTTDAEISANLYNDAMFKVFKNIEGYKEDGKIIGWVKRIVINTCIDYIRLKTPIPTIEIKESNEAEYAIEETVLHKMSAQDIQKIIRQLPKSLATVFNLYVYEEYNHTEIAELLKIPSGTSRYYLSEARRLLKSKIQNNIISLNTIH
jgi:RNA polymerase sigma-70 factor, ECF subfamily